MSILYRCNDLDTCIDQIYKNVKVTSQNEEFEIYGFIIQRVVNIDVNPPETLKKILEPSKPLVRSDEDNNKKRKL